jgi:Icc-related predicted phosphoesterase
VGTYSQVPVDTDILVTHSPPYGILDQASDSDRHEGCHQFLAAVQRIKPMLQVFGYVHGACGTLSVADTLFVNAALPGHGFGMSNPRTCSSCRDAKVAVYGLRGPAFLNKRRRAGDLPVLVHVV